MVVDFKGQRFFVMPEIELSANEMSSNNSSSGIYTIFQSNSVGICWQSEWIADELFLRFLDSESSSE
jgi:hypothetical protein